MRSARLLVLAAFSTACGGESTSSKHGDGGITSIPASTGGGGLGGTGGTRDFIPDQGCTDDADCSFGEVCLHYTANGPAECVARRVPATRCEVPNGRDQCCSSADCERGTCFNTIVAAGPVCGLGGFDAFNQCLSDTCESDGDCSANEGCLPSGFGDLRACMPASCRADADCTAERGGACIPFGDRCCYGFGKVNTYRPKQLTCVYAGDGCKEDADCPSMQYCVVEHGRAHCSPTCQ